MNIHVRSTAGVVREVKHAIRNVGVLSKTSLGGEDMIHVTYLHAVRSRRYPDEDGLECILWLNSSCYQHATLE